MGCTFCDVFGSVSGQQTYWMCMFCRLEYPEYESMVQRLIPLAVDMVMEKRGRHPVRLPILGQ